MQPKERYIKLDQEKKRNYLKYGLHVAIFVGVIWAALKYVNGEEVIAALRRFDYGVASLMVGLALATLFLKAARFVFLLRPFAQDLPLITILKAYVAGQGATVLPGGVAARAGILRQIGVPVSEGSIPVLANSLFDQLFFVTLGLISALWYPQARLPGLIILATLAVVAVLLLLEPTRTRIAQLGEKIAERFNVGDQWRNFLNCVPLILDAKILVVGLVTTALAFAFFIIVLRFALQGLDMTASYAALALAYILPTMLGRLVPIPAGLGVTEATMVGFLASAAGIATDAAVAGVAIFRIAAIFVPILFGAIVYFFLWRGEAEVRSKKPEVEAAHASHSDI